MDNQLSNIKVKIPNKMSIYKKEIETILEKDEEIIRKYLEKSVFKCFLSDTVKQELEEIFQESKETVLEKF